MHYLIILAMILLPSQVLFDFSPEAGAAGWFVQNDTVMGGRSSSELTINTDGYAEFSGSVSLENNGGFASIQTSFDPVDISQHTHFKLRIKGDGNRYQIRAKNRAYDRYSYIYYVTTTGDWQTVSIPFDEMKPQFRGRSLNMPNFAGEQVGGMGILIGNKEEQEFKIEVDWIGVE